MQSSGPTCKSKTLYGTLLGAFLSFGGGGDFPKDKQDERRQRPITVMRGMYLARHRLKSTWWIRLPPAMAFGQQGEYYNMWPNMDITLAILFKGHRCDIEAIQPIWPNMDTTLAILFKGHRCDIEAIQPREPLGLWRCQIVRDEAARTKLHQAWMLK